MATPPDDDTGISYLRALSRDGVQGSLVSHGAVAMLASPLGSQAVTIFSNRTARMDQQQSRNHTTNAANDTAETKAEQAKSALAEAVAKRTEERKLNDKQQGGGPHGGKPMSTLKVSAQTRGKL
ncbi:hypothetical protein [Lichenifustis flavocetrariae]|uniref:Uncharacterized protein n=1 Tax=Lichenifustis flavocetrariae TaxID=2949735 RepID=A0AA42CGW5_9HYPH|nr:hypothetical protein [Lichenifustis flavocetrariae]MCW6506978.1 hypothetical protein [Lichenifustis flavocetrariae]